MSDRKLLELAAKAAGYRGYQDGCAIVGERGQSITWNPLTDDGDALRLAVKLEIGVLPSMEQVSARNPSYTGWINENAPRDPYAATRRAIVRTAAEIGKRMTAQEGDP